MEHRDSAHCRRPAAGVSFGSTSNVPSFMARRTALALLLVVISPYLLACIPQEGDEALPPCCRRDGKHRCAKMARLTAQEQGKDPSFRAAGDPCPYPNALFVPAARHLLGMPPSRAFYACVVSHPALAIQTVLAASISGLRSDSERGPPPVRS